MIWCGTNSLLPLERWGTQKFSLYTQDFVTKAVADIMKAGAVSAPSPGVLPLVIIPLGLVPKQISDKLWLAVKHMKYVNEHLARQVFLFEGLSDLFDMTDKGDYWVAYDLTSGYYHVSLHSDSWRFVGLNWKKVHYHYNCFPFGLSATPLVFSKLIRELVMYWRAKGINLLPD